MNGHLRAHHRRGVPGRDEKMPVFSRLQSPAPISLSSLFQISRKALEAPDPMASAPCLSALGHLPRERSTAPASATLLGLGKLRPLPLCSRPSISRFGHALDFLLMSTLFRPLDSSGLPPTSVASASVHPTVRLGPDSCSATPASATSCVGLVRSYSAWQRPPRPPPTSASCILILLDIPPRPPPASALASSLDLGPPRQPRHSASATSRIGLSRELIRLPLRSLLIQSGFHP